MVDGMNPLARVRSVPIPCLSGCLILLLVLPVLAHRLDECLQATRIAIAPDRVEVTIHLTPGVEVAEAVLQKMDLNRDQTLSPLEAEAYAELLLRDVTLKVDGQPQRLVLSDVDCASTERMRSGLGTLLVKAGAQFPRLSPGPHELFFRNQHHTNVSAYLVNALVPKTPGMVIERQVRDVRQTEVRIDFRWQAAEVDAPTVPEKSSANQTR